ncbi:methyltransferase domain-containing protein [Nocardioides seonyuensis]|uniref:Methyltransferase domain-containing protein n=2 Tax=Nocardioides seonyuensis TaxID=2518371 RepID=A0A4P7IHQ2_9ACTN|nr:methyltransferase domain-containing protein [Nocardioides seonyuensis]
MTTLEHSPAHHDAVASEEVADRIIGIMNDGAICVLIGIGHDLGLFDTLAELPPATSEQIADAAGLDERYTREWLGGIVTAGLVEYDALDRTYALLPDHAPFLSGPGPDNLSRVIRYVNMMGEVSAKVAEKFRTGGGLSYEEYPGFHDIQAAESRATHDASLLDMVVPVTGMTERLRSGITVADIGCGQGHAVNLLARAFPASRFVGFDLSPEPIAAARAEAAEWGLTNATFHQCDVATLPPESVGAYDLVTAFDAIHDQKDPARVLANARAALRPDGAFLMVDFNAHSCVEDNLGLPWASFIYAISTTHCMSVSLGQGGAGLGTAWGVETAEEMLRAAGFSDVVRHELEADPFNAYFMARP